MSSKRVSCLGDISIGPYAACVMLLVASLYVLLGVRDLVPSNIRGFFIIALPFALSYLATPFVCRLARLLNVVDVPNERKMHKDTTPLMGGLAIFVAFGTGAVSTLWYSLELKGVVYAATIIFVLGLLDDIFGLSSVIRLVVQLIAVYVLFLHGLEIDSIPDNTRYHVFDKLVTAIWILGITNAVNFLDGLDGLCVGFGAIAALIFGIIAFLTQQYFLMFLAFSLSGSCFGFLPWNFRPNKPASIFLGDAGSLFIGFTLASFAVMGEWAENNVVALMVPILILFLPIYDTAMTTFFRIKEGKVRTVGQWLDYVGKDHFHHRLFAMGIGTKSAVWTLYLVTILLGFSAIMIRTGGLLEAYLALSQACIVMIFTTAFIVSIRKKMDRIEDNCS